MQTVQVLFGSVCVCSVTQSCLIICSPMDHRLPGSSVRGILQARILEWVAIPFSRRSSRPRDCLLHLLNWQVESLPLSHLGIPFGCVWTMYSCVLKIQPCSTSVSIILIDFSEYYTSIRAMRWIISKLIIAQYMLPWFGGKEIFCELCFYTEINEAVHWGKRVTELITNM